MQWHERLRLTLNRPTLLWAVPVGVAALIAVVLVINWGTTEKTVAEKIEQSVDICKRIRLGMTKEQVLMIMPTPVGTISYKKNGQEKEKLLFPSQAAASTPPQTVIDRSADRVEEVVCDDEYRLRRDQR